MKQEKFVVLSAAKPVKYRSHVVSEMETVARFLKVGSGVLLLLLLLPIILSSVM